MRENLRKYLAEFIGTAFLVILGCGTAVALTAAGGTVIPTALAVTGIALAFGLALTAIIYTIGHISGAHVNPAVSLAMAVKGKLSWKDFIFYAAAQILGAVAGAAILFAITKLIGVNAMGANSYSGNALAGLEIWTGIAAAAIVEAVLTFIFVLTILGTTSRKENGAAAGVVIGLTLAVVHLFGIMFTGTSVNPARSFGPALFGGADALKEVWLFIAAPLVGAVLAALVSIFLHREEGQPEVAAQNKTAEHSRIAEQHKIAEQPAVHHKSK